MNPEVLCLVTAAARASAFVRRPDASDRQLDPPHPAFVSFRRMTYVWKRDGQQSVVAQGTRRWLEFLRGRGVSAVGVEMSGDGWRLVAAGDAGIDTWVPSVDEGAASLHGVASQSEVLRPLLTGSADRVERAAHDLQGALQRAVQTHPDGVRGEELRRALLILESEDDGSEASDVAWPYFALPEVHYDVVPRRLFAAAAAAWPPSGDDPLADASAAAVVAAVNWAPPGSASREPVE